MKTKLFEQLLLPSTPLTDEQRAKVEAIKQAVEQSNATIEVACRSVGVNPGYLYNLRSKSKVKKKPVLNVVKLEAEHDDKIEIMVVRGKASDIQQIINSMREGV